MAVREKSTSGLFLPKFLRASAFVIGKQLNHVIQVFRGLAERFERSETSREMGYRKISARLGVSEEAFKGFDLNRPRNITERVERFLVLTEATRKLMTAVKRQRQGDQSQPCHCRPVPGAYSRKHPHQPRRTGRNSESVRRRTDELTVAIMEGLKRASEAALVGCFFHGKPPVVDGESEIIHSATGTASHPNGSRP